MLNDKITNFIVSVEYLLIIITRLLCIPGVILHELCHYLIAKLLGVKIAEVKLITAIALNYKNYNGILGYVGYDKNSIKSKTSLEAFFISAAPLLTNIPLILLIQFHIINFYFFSIFGFVTSLFYLCIFLSSFPSTGDFENFVFHLEKNQDEGWFYQFAWLAFLLIVYLGQIIKSCFSFILKLLLIALMCQIIITESPFVMCCFIAFCIWCVLHFLNKSLKIKKRFPLRAINANYRQTFPNSAISEFLKKRYKLQNIIYNALGLKVDIKKTLLHEFLHHHPEAQETKNFFKDGVRYILPLEGKIFDCSTKGWFYFGARGGLEEIIINFNVDKTEVLSKIYNAILKYDKLIELEEFCNIIINYQSYESKFDGNNLKFLYIKSCNTLQFSYSAPWYKYRCTEKDEYCD